MIIVKVGQPTNPNYNDVWFDPTNKITMLFATVSAPTPMGAWSPLFPSHKPNNPQKGQVYVDVVTDIPNLWDGMIWIPAVPPSYPFPPLNPPNGTKWLEPMSHTLYEWNNPKWKLIPSITVPPGITNVNYSYMVSSGAVGISGPITITIPGSNSNIAVPQQINIPLSYGNGIDALGTPIDPMKKKIDDFDRAMGVIK